MHQPHNFLYLRIIKQSRREIGPCCTFVDLADSRVGRNHRRNLAHLQPIGDSKGPDPDMFARLMPHDRCANRAAPHDHHLDEAGGFALGNGPVVLGKVEADNFDIRTVFCSRLCFGQPDLCQLGSV